MRGHLLLWLLLVQILHRQSWADLPIYIEDSHAGTFYWITQNVRLSQEYNLVLIDAHSDATEILSSDWIRRQVARAASDGRLEDVTRQWRSLGTIQCFNWIEPLIPRPLARVYWVAGDSLTSQQRARKIREVEEQINTYEEAAPRVAGDFRDRYEVLDLAHLSELRSDAPVIVTIDLDYLAGGGRLDHILDRVLGLKNLQALTFSISRPYLASEAQSHQLLYDTLDYTTRVVNADIQFEPFLTTGPDRSLKAKEFLARRTAAPRYQIEGAPPLLQSLILRGASRIRVEFDRPRWERLLRKWRSELKPPRVTLHPGDYLRAGQPFRLTLENAAPGPRIEWKVLKPGGPSYNLTGVNQGYAEGAPAFVLCREQTVAGADGHLEVVGDKLIPYLDPRTGWGTLRVCCKVGDVWSNVVCFSRSGGDGYPGKLTEIFNLPYVYGGALLRADGKSGADARYGADCANFIIYGKRRQGANIPYVNPKGLLPYLEELDEFRGFQDGVALGRQGPMVVRPESLAKGVLLHFGAHIAAVFQAGVMTEGTLVAHQLENAPELTTLGAMARRYPHIRIMTFKEQPDIKKPAEANEPY